MIESDDGLYIATLRVVDVFIHNGNLSSEFFKNKKNSWVNVGKFLPRVYEGNHQVSGGCLVKW